MKTLAGSVGTILILSALPALSQSQPTLPPGFLLPTEGLPPELTFTPENFQSSPIDGASLDIVQRAIPLFSGAAPGSEDSEQVESWTGREGRMDVYDVTQPTITPYLPSPENATGAAVIVAPGGGFQYLTMKGEGENVALWLQSQGIAAFVLKYRTLPNEGYSLLQLLQPSITNPSEVRSYSDYVVPELPADDARQALKIVRERAGEWQIDPDRVGFMGFSAGAFTGLKVVLDGEGERPDFLAIIYGPMANADVPADAPPLFAVSGANDFLLMPPYGLISDWRMADRSVEFHLYHRAGHAFELGESEGAGTERNWPDQFIGWMDDQGFLSPSNE